MFLTDTFLNENGKIQKNIHSHRGIYVFLLNGENFEFEKFIDDTAPKNEFIKIFQRID